jgi:multisubunit Na+/H+ antiporter MnhF subunit
VRNTGPRTRHIGTALIIIAFLLVAVRFFARWSIQDSSIGWDDWTILLAFICLVPSTAIAQISESETPTIFLFPTLIR